MYPATITNICTIAYVDLILDEQKTLPNSTSTYEPKLGGSELLPPYKVFVMSDIVRLSACCFDFCFLISWSRNHYKSGVANKTSPIAEYFHRTLLQMGVVGRFIRVKRVSDQSVLF